MKAKNHIPHAAIDRYLAATEKEVKWLAEQLEEVYETQTKFAKLGLVVKPNPRRREFNAVIRRLSRTRAPKY